MNDIMEHITKVRKHMLREYIKANTIIIDEDVAKVNGFWFPEAVNCFGKFPTIFLGLKVDYEKDLSLKLGIDTNFVMLKSEELKPKTLADYTTDELLEEIKRRLN